MELKRWLKDIINAQRELAKEKGNCELSALTYSFEGAGRIRNAYCSRGRKAIKITTTEDLEIFKVML